MRDVYTIPADMEVSDRLENWKQHFFVGAIGFLLLTVALFIGTAVI